MEKSNRPVRNRRHSRKSWLPNETHRPIKRLFTPEIKRMLKDWLVRRRENPYPSRGEKKTLANETGLTYIQICNWFANWRRKLKNSGNQPQKKTWGHLIKNYNTNAKGNVEQFSICSGDSIWHDDEMISHFTDTSQSTATYNNNEEQRNFYRYPDAELYDTQYYKILQKNNTNNEDGVKYLNGNCYITNSPVVIMDHCYTPNQQNNKIINGVQAQCFQISSTTDEINTPSEKNENGIDKLAQLSSTKYKNHIMEKYLRGLDDTITKTIKTTGPQLNKWLESTANFTPNKNNYIAWSSEKLKTERRKSKSNNEMDKNRIVFHQKEELDAAEALTKLAGNFRTRLLNMRMN